MVSVREVETRLEGFKNMLSFETVGNYIIIHAKEWMSQEDFAKITTLVKEFNGERVGGIGKESHWRVPVSTAVVGSAVNMRERLKQIRSDLDKIIEEMQ